MSERPLLLLPAAVQPVARDKGNGRGSNFHRPSRDRQVERLGPRFEELQRVFAERAAEVRSEVGGVMPEQVIVFETIGTVDEFVGAVRKIEGLEWLGEVELEHIPSDRDFFALSKTNEARPQKELSGRLFLVYSNQRALRKVLSLWSRWNSGEDLFERGLNKWKHVFAQLRDVRPWGVRERLLETGVLDDWQQRVAQGQELVPTEIELWFHLDRNSRSLARKRVLELVEAEGGTVHDEATIEEISYHAILATLPVSGIGKVLNDPLANVGLLRCEQIQFFRASGQMIAPASQNEEVLEETAKREKKPSEGLPIVALLDGMPLQNHDVLQGRLIIDDPEGIEDLYGARERCHGTAMASLIVNGDLGSSESPLVRPLYVRPIMQPDINDFRIPRVEAVSDLVLLPDLIHRSVRRLFEADRQNPPVAPTICIINLSVCIKDRPFESALSPLAKLIDWLSWKYKVLFVVSAGNYADALELSVLRTQLQGLSRLEQQQEILRAVASAARNRRLMSPSEAPNALTVASVHGDASQIPVHSYRLNPYLDEGLPSPFNAQGMGFKRAIKPDLLAPGGRILYQEALGTTVNTVCEFCDDRSVPGQQVAAPGSMEGDTRKSWFSRGTSNAAAMTSRGGAILYELLQELRDEPGGELIESVPYGIWLKTLIAHSASWRAARPPLESALRNPENSQHFREYLTRLLGFGTIDIPHVQECTKHRVTALSGGYLQNGQAHIHELPLPPSLSGKRGLRRLTVSLSWISPINPFHQAWRRADLWFSSANPLAVERVEADGRAVQRGTLQHEVFEGNQARAFTDGDKCRITVNCRADAGSLDESVPYSLAISFEVGHGLDIDVYNEIRTRVHAGRVRVQPSTD